MRQFILMTFAIALAFAFSPGQVRAQDGADLMRGIIGFAAGEIERQHRREQQKRAYRRRHRQFKASWHACFQNNLSACNQALAYQHIHPNDRDRLKSKHRSLVAERQQAAERTRLTNMERQRLEREQVESRIAEQRTEAQRLQLARDQEARERARRYNDERQRAERRLAEQRAEAQRMQRRREQEERRLAGLRAFGQSLNACRGYDISVCGRALQSSHASSHDLSQLRRWRDEAKSYERNRAACQAGERSS